MFSNTSYNEARKLKLEQDEYCVKAQAHQWTGLPAQIPKDLKWEALVDVLRGRVKVRCSLSDLTTDHDALKPRLISTSMRPSILPASWVCRTSLNFLSLRSITPTKLIWSQTSSSKYGEASLLESLSLLRMLGISVNPTVVLSLPPRSCTKTEFALR